MKRARVWVSVLVGCLVISLLLIVYTDQPNAAERMLIGYGRAERSYLAPETHKTAGVALVITGLTDADLARMGGQMTTAGWKLILNDPGGKEQWAAPGAKGAWLDCTHKSDGWTATHFRPATSIELALHRIKKTLGIGDDWD